MARKLDINQLRKAKSNQFKPNATSDESQVEVEQVKKKTTTPKYVAPVKKKVAKKEVKKVGRPVSDDKKPTRATSIRVHPDLVDVPKILAGISRKNVYSMYNEIIADALVKYKKKYPELLADLNVPPKSEL